MDKHFHRLCSSYPNEKPHTISTRLMGPDPKGDCAMAKKPASAEGTSMHDLVEHVGLEIRRMGAQSVMMSQVIADRFGIHTTDLECLDLITMRQQTTAGELARATGLTSGAMTALLDRLERAGYISRVHDSVDRRRITIQVREEAIEPIKAVYAPIGERMAELWSRFTADELKTVSQFLRRSTDLGVVCIEEIRKETVSPVTRRRPRTSRSRID
jgi:DNA-binding MarR family transcriptional regulator